MPLVIYLGLHVIMRGSTLILPSEQRQITLGALNVNAPAATVEEEKNLSVEGKEGQSAQVMLFDTLPEEAVSTISQWLRQDTANHITLVWLQPWAYIAAKLAQEVDVENALQEWQHMANATLTFFRQHRRQVTLVAAEPGVEPPKCDKISLLTLPDPEHASLYTLAAKQLLANHTELQEIAAQLSASSASVYSQAEVEKDTVLDALQDHQKNMQRIHDLEQQLSAEKVSQQQIAEQRKALAGVNEENDLVIAELHRIQELLEIKLNELQKHETWGQWLRAYAARYVIATYRHSRTHRKALNQHIELLKSSQHFDAQWYLDQYPDVASSKMDPAVHYLKFGALEGRNPGLNFNTEFYITQNIDIAKAGRHPLLHFLRYGKIEQRQTTFEQRQLPSPAQVTLGANHE